MPAVRFHRKQPRISKCTQALTKICVDFDGREVVIIEPRSLQTLVVEAKPQRLHQVERRARVGAQANGIAGIRRNLRLEEHDVKHLEARAALAIAARVRKNHALRRIIEFHAQTANFIDDAEIHGLLQIEQRIDGGLLNEIRELEVQRRVA